MSHSPDLHMSRTNCIVFAALLLTGCYKATVNLGGGGSPGVERRVTVHGLVGGLISLNEIDAANVCGDKGVWSVSSRHNVIDMILSGITGGLYTPVTVLVICKG